MTMTAEAPTAQRILNVPLDQIEVGPRHRVRTDVSRLKDGIERLGLLHPITLTDVGVSGGFAFKLAAGAGRLAAFRELGYPTIPSFIAHLDELDAEEVEITENLNRDELSFLEEAEHLERLEQILRAKGERAMRGRPATTSSNGVTRDRFSLAAHNGSDEGVDDFDTEGTAPAAVEEETALRTTKQLSEERGLSERSYRRRLQIVHGLPEPVRDLVRGSEIADNYRELLSLTQFAPEQQEKVAREIHGGAPSIKVALDNLGLGSVRKDDGAEEERDEDEADDDGVTGPGSDVPERYKVVRAEVLVRWPMPSWRVRVRNLPTGTRIDPREDEWAEREFALTTDERALDPDTGTDFLIEDLTRQLRQQLRASGFPGRAGW